MNDAIFAYTRSLDDEMLLVINNFYEHEVDFVLPSTIKFGTSELLISNYSSLTSTDFSQFSLRPYESVVYKLKK